MYKSLLSLRNSSTGYSFYCYCSLLKFIIIRTTCRQDKEQPNREHMKPIASEIIPPREENEVNILNYSTQIFRKINFRNIPPGCSWLPHTVGPWRMQFAIQQVIKLFVDNTMPRETQWKSGADGRLTCTPKCFGVYVMASLYSPFSGPPCVHLPLCLTWSYALVLTLSFSLSDRKKGKGGVDEQELEHREFFVCLLHMVSFKHAYWTHYTIIYFHI